MDVLQSFTPSELQTLIDELRRRQMMLSERQNTTSGSSSSRVLKKRKAQRSTTSRAEAPEGGQQNQQGNVLAPNTQKRKLNAFIAFRSYYARIFIQFSQGIISPTLGYLWKDDLFKPKWESIAHAYNHLRDTNTTVNVDLPGFLSIACPLMGIPAPESYLNTIEVSVRIQDGVPQLVRMHAPPVLPQAMMVPAPTQNDIIQAYMASLHSTANSVVQPTQPAPPPAHLVNQQAAANAGGFMQNPLNHNGDTPWDLSLEGTREFLHAARAMEHMHPEGVINTRAIHPNNPNPSYPSFIRQANAVADFVHLSSDGTEFAGAGISPLSEAAAVPSYDDNGGLLNTKEENGQLSTNPELFGEYDFSSFLESTPHNA